MGQRTQIFLQTVDNKGGKRTKAYHIQWGNGRVMPLMLMRLVINDYFKDTFSKDYSIHNLAFSEHPAYDITEELKGHIADDIDIENVPLMAGLFTLCDNNNGGMVVQVIENETNYMLPKVRIGFMLGWEDSDEPFSRYVSLDEFAKEVGGCYFDTDGGKELFQSFVDYFDIDMIVTPKEK